VGVGVHVKQCACPGAPFRQSHRPLKQAKAPDDLVELVKRWIEQRKAEGAGTDSLMFPNAGCTRERRSATAIVMTSATESPSGSPRIERLLSSTSS
jgi:hypothetical protein